VNDAGYTLVETMAALAIVSLAVGGLTAAVQTLGRQQRAVTETLLAAEAPAAARAALQRMLDGQGPFRAHEPGRFTGDATRLAFDCGEPQPCRAELVDAIGGQVLRATAGGRIRDLPLRRAGLRFRYRGTSGPFEAWPPVSPARQALRSLALGAPGAPALVEARVWAEQPAACAFDPILQDCR